MPLPISKEGESPSPHRFSSDPKIDHSLGHSVKDAVSHQVMVNAGESYFSAFALFLKASTAQIAWLASLPPLLGSLAQLLSIWIGRRSGRRRHIIVTGAFLQGFIWLPLLLLPWLFPAYAVPLLIGCVVVHHALGHLAAPQWSSLMGDLVPAEQRGRYFAMRTCKATITGFGALVCAGVTLHFFDEHGYTFAGFVVIFVIAAIARFKSTYHLAAMHDPATASEGSGLRLTDLRRRLQYSPFIQFCLFYALMQFSVAIAGPFFTVYMLRDLKFSYVEFMISTATSVVMQFLTLTTWGRLSDRFGNRFVLTVTGWFIPCLPALWLMSNNFYFLIFAQALGGAVWAGFSLSAGNYIYDSVPRERRATYAAFHGILTSFCVFCGAMIGGYITSLPAAKWTLLDWQLNVSSSLLIVFFISALARLVVAAMFLPKLQEMRKVDTFSFPNLWLQIRRYSPFFAINQK